MGEKKGPMHGGSSFFIYFLGMEIRVFIVAKKHPGVACFKCLPPGVGMSKTQNDAMKKIPV